MLHCGNFSHNIYINGSPCHPCFHPFMGSFWGFPPMSMHMFSPMNFLCFNTGAALGNFVAGKALSLLC